jgi:hypothetical protein
MSQHSNCSSQALYVPMQLHTLGLLEPGLWGSALMCVVSE